MSHKRSPGAYSRSWRLHPHSVSDKIARLATTGMSVEKIAEITGWRRSSVRNVIAKRKLIAKRLGRKGIALAEHVNLPEMKEPARLVAEGTLSRQAYDMRKAGYEYSEIAAALNRSIQRAQLMIHDATRPLRRVTNGVGQGVHLLKYSKSEQIVLLRLTGLSFREIAKQLNMKLRPCQSHFAIRNRSKLAFCATYPHLDLYPVMKTPTRLKIRKMLGEGEAFEMIAKRLGVQLEALKFVVEKAPNLYRAPETYNPCKDHALPWSAHYSFEKWDTYLPAGKAGLSAKGQNTLKAVAAEYGQHIADEIIVEIGAARHRERFIGYADILSVKAVKGDLNLKIRCNTWRRRYDISVKIPYDDPNWAAFLSGHDVKLGG